jgi:hypothetical protein
VTRKASVAAAIALTALVCACPAFGAIGNVLVNPGLEAGDLRGWTTYGTIVTPQWNVADPIFDGLFASGSYSIPAHTGGYMAGSVGSWQCKDGGMYQRFEVVPGQTYSAKAWIYTWAYDAGGMAQPRNCEVRIGLDPTGGTDLDERRVIWTPPHWAPYPGDPEIYFSVPEQSWTQIPYGTVANPFDASVVWPLTVTAAGPVMTVFIEMWQWYDWQWTETLVDDVEVIGEVPGPPGVYIYNITETAVSTSRQRIEFETQMPSIGRIDWGTTTGYGSSQQDAAPSLLHSFDLAPVTCNTTYHYRLTATAPGYNTGDTGDRILVAAIPVDITNVDVTSVSPTSVTISWTTDLASDSMVEYGETTAYGSQVSDPTMTTSHMLTLTGLSANTWYHYRIHSDPGVVTCRKPGITADARFLTPPVPAQNLMVNGSFEDGIAPWVPYAYSFQPEFGDPGLPHLQCSPWPDWGIPEAYDGSCFLGNEASYDCKWGGAYQIVSGLTPGQEYVITAWQKTYYLPTPEEPSNCQNRIGVDPTAGTDPGSANVDWGAYDYTLNSQPWKVMTHSFTASGTQATVFLETEQRYDVLLHVNAFDGVTLLSAAPGTQEISSPAGTVVAGWNLISLPWDPVNGDPEANFAGLNIEGRLFCWKADERRYAAYISANPADFGTVQAGVGYWLYADGPETITYNAYPRAVSATVGMPVGGWQLIGCPQTSACSVRNNGAGVTRAYAQAAASGWLNDCLFWYQPATKSYQGSGLDDWDADSFLRPWRGYWARTTNGLDLDLIVPH